VVGAGVVGLAACDALARRGVDVCCLERGEPGQGQSAGLARGFRHLHAEPALIRRAVAAREGWRAWEERSGLTLLGREGALRRGPELGAEVAALRAAGVAAETITASDALERMPFLAPRDEPLLFDPAAGALRALEAVAMLARRAGSRLVRTHVASLEPRRRGVRLRTAAGAIDAGASVVCAGAGAERLLGPLGLGVRQDRRAHLRLTFRVRRPGPSGSPTWSDRSGVFGATAYGVAEGRDRYAVGIADPGAYPSVAGEAEDVPATVDVAPARRRVLAYVAFAFPGLELEPVDAVLRLTTALPGGAEDGWSIERGDGVIALQGHNLFKWAPVLGEELATAALG
jgi:sarcosine oxidase